MPNTYSQLYIHLVFAVKGRESLIDVNWKEELYKYICGIALGKQQKVFAINGMPDHIHILLSIKPDVAISDIVRDLKSNSTNWINLKKFVAGKFQWQEGFGAFSCSKSQLDILISYIKNQEEHHSKKSFKTEYIELLKKFEIEFDEKYLFAWID